jgi:Na+-transporting NADH:ubiquinone oxidoreductase subunit NqrB
MAIIIQLGNSLNYASIVKALGWIGTLAYVVAYLLLSLNKIRSDRTLYHILNIAGAVGLIFDALYLNDLPNLVINIVWALIAAFAIYLIWKRKDS